MRRGKTMPSVYVQPLGAYNEGRGGGAWVEVDSDPDLFQDAINEVLEASPVRGEEEWGFHDYDGFPKGLGLGEYESVEDLSKLVELFEEHDEGAVAGALDIAGGTNYLDEVENILGERYAGEWKSLEDWGWEFLEGTGALQEVPESLKNYIDVEKWARDAQLGGDISTYEDASGMVHVFWSH
jgi:antirestriction protein